MRVSVADGFSAKAIATALAVVIAALFLFVTVAPSFAQERPRSLFEFLFKPLKRRQAEEPVKQPRATIKRRNTARSSAAAVDSTPSPAAVAKADEARVVLVIGDFLASGLAEGLTTVFDSNATVRVVEKSRGASGIVRDDHYNWPAEIGALIDEQKPAVVVVMIGSNDRQEMRVAGEREPKRSEKWTAEYEKRVERLAKAVADRRIPLVWVGMPSFRQASASSDMLAFNDIYRAATEASGGAFVDIWDGFVDENGAYVTTGPDINGNPVRLRSGENGINLTKAGKRKVAFYAEKPLERILGSAKPPVIGALGPNGLPAPTKGAPLLPTDIDRTNPIALTDPELDGGVELLGASFSPGGDKVATPAEKLTRQGVASPPITGRADDFGDGVAPKAASAPPPAADEKTTAIAN
jgi:hypothetical protein